jgi:hypothetical protein
MEYASEGSLLTYLDKALNGSTDDWQVIMDCTLDVALGLEDLHSAKIIHRYDQQTSSFQRLLNLKQRST